MPLHTPPRACSALEVQTPSQSLLQHAAQPSDFKKSFASSLLWIKTKSLHENTEQKYPWLWSNTY